MTRVAVIADSHFDETSRFGECCEIHDWVAADIRQREVDLVLHAGDVFERRSTPAERIKVAEWLQYVAGFAPVVVVRGNHDSPLDLELLESTFLRTRNPIVIEERAGVHVVAGVAVACLAWPRKAQLLAQLELQGREVGEFAAGDALRAVLRGMGQQLAEHEGPRVLLAHAMVRGSMTSTGQPLVGCDLEVGLEDLALARADFYALGHVHKGQDWTISGAPAVYPGSPRRTAFGELEAKGYLIVDFDEVDGRRAAREDWPRWERVETAATPMVLVEDEWGPDETGAHGFLAGAHGLPRSCKGAELRFRYHVAADQRDAARTLASRWRDDWLAEGAVSVKVEEVVESTAAVRLPEVARAQTTADRLRAFWRARREEPEPERAGRLLEKTASIEVAS